MERLTYTDKEMEEMPGMDCPVREDDGSIVQKFCSEVCGEFGKDCPYKEMGKKLKEYEDAEEKGLLLRLPYNLGTCGVLYYACEEDSEVYRLRADEVTISKTMISNKFCYLIDSLEFCFEDFGKIIFRTEAEAEKALEEMGE